MNRKIALILGALITLSVETDSSPAESPVYRLKGASVHLTVEGLEHPQIRRMSWRVNTTDMMEYTPWDTEPQYFRDYAIRTQFDSSDFSLLIKNLDETDQGTYTAIIFGKGGGVSDKAKYRLYVQEAVAKPIIQMNNSTLDSAEGFCTVSVNCSVRDSWVYYTCDQTQCSQTESQSWPDVNITVTVYNGNITCTGSNWVSKETQSEPLGHACMKSDGIIVPPSLWYIVLILGIVCLCLCIGLIYFKMCRKGHPRNPEHVNLQGEPGQDGANT